MDELENDLLISELRVQRNHSLDMILIPIILTDGDFRSLPYIRFEIESEDDE